MAITMQGSWTVRVSILSAAFKQRFIVTGASVGNGVYGGAPGTTVFASGAQWSLNVQNSSDGGATWADSAQRITFPVVSGGLLKFDVRSDDRAADKDYNDLVLTCSMPASSSDYVVYGTAKTYSGRCFRNPCRNDYVVLDPHVHLESICERFPEICRVIEKLYPERIVKRPFPLPDPAPDVRPIVLPIGVVSAATGIAFQSKGLPAQFDAPAEKAEKLTPDAREKRTTEQLQTTARAVTFNAAAAKSGIDLLSSADRAAIASIIDAGIKVFPCNVDPAPGLLLRFQEYDRTVAEKLGGAYTGTGDRQDLGLSVTDELGNYIFRFTPSLVDIAAEVSDVASGESLATQLRPDVIIQVLGTGMTMTYETAPYYNILNVQRIDLCIPYASAHPNRACAGDRVIQRVGDVIVLHSALGAHPNTLDADGRITCRNANAPQVDCAGWRGGLRLYCCFGKPEAVRYAIYYKLPSETNWHAVNQAHVLNYIPDFAPGYTGTPVGPTLSAVNPSVPTGLAPNTPIPTYANHENDLNWIENDLKMILSSSLYRAEDDPGPVEFHIEAYDSAGHVIAATEDTITLYIHNQTTMVGRPQGSKGDIQSITMGAVTLGDCALFNLSSANAALTVKNRAVDPAGFLQGWTLTVTRGNNNNVPVSVVAGVAPRTYNTPPAPMDCDFTGTREFGNVDDYVTTDLQPSAGANWLPNGVTFCAFAFTLRANDRVTDGRNGYPEVVFWQDLIGLSFGS